ncbi:MAG: ABC transporter ATP-binding protein, partial [Flavobacteriales bacterium]|nr:ABC transporter ATP-binding protein [Flavobacteriales bacterium]
EGLFDEVRLPDPARIFGRHPHQLSGGQKQRVMIAMALSCAPRLLICDEPTTALDVLVQREILDLLKELRRRRRMAMLFITHDLGVVREVADRVLVMHRGRVVEEAPTHRLFARPAHPYTQGLIACRPDPAVHPERLPTVDEVMRDPDALAPHRRRHTAPAERMAAAEALARQEPLLRVTGLGKTYPGRAAPFRRATPDVPVLHDIDLCVYPGETLGVVGGSGSGKTTLGRTVLRLLEPTAGRVSYKGTDITALPAGAMRALRREVQIVFQDPYAALNPRMAVGPAIIEAMRVHGIGHHDRDRRHAVQALLERVGLESAHYDRFPHQFSGGQRQRIVIARAIALRPRLVVCDESVAALDVSVQAQVLNLLNELKAEHGLTYIFISHDLNVVQYFCDRVLVLERGRVVETGPAHQVYFHPQAPYTQALVAAIPGTGHSPR